MREEEKAQLVGSYRKNRGYILIALLLAIMVVIVGFRNDWWSSSASPKTSTGEGMIYPIPSGGIWRALENTSMHDYVSIAFSSNGIFGMAVTSQGGILQTLDGGYEWQPLTDRVPITEGEKVTGLCVDEEGGMLIGTVLDADESTYTGFYRYQPGVGWKMAHGDFGGIAGGSGDGRFLTGGGGLIAILDRTGYRLIRLPDEATTTLYSAAAIGSNLIAVGTEGLIARSSDGGEVWEKTRHGIPLGASHQPCFYAVSLRNHTAIVGGLDGLVLRSDDSGENWHKVYGLSIEQMVQAIFLDVDGVSALLGGGKTDGGDPFIATTFNAGLTWNLDVIEQSHGRISGFAKGKAGIFAVTDDGALLIRRTAGISK
jgi:photosystem II stability/assembly factor-like uncharacterized protein